MFDIELTSVIAIFAGIAALIAYISERAKRKIKTSGQPVNIKKMPRAEETSAEQTSLDGWYFPQPSQETEPSTYPVEATAKHAMQARTASKSNDQTLDNITTHAIGRTPDRRNSAHVRFGTRAKLREAIVTMSVLGPCRSLAPYQEREHY